MNSTKDIVASMTVDAKRFLPVALIAPGAINRRLGSMGVTPANRVNITQGDAAVMADGAIVIGFPPIVTFKTKSHRRQISRIRLSAEANIAMACSTGRSFGQMRGMRE